MEIIGTLPQWKITGILFLNIFVNPSQSNGQDAGDVKSWEDLQKDEVQVVSKITRFISLMLKLSLT